MNRFITVSMKAQYTPSSNYYALTDPEKRKLYTTLELYFYYNWLFEGPTWRSFGTCRPWRSRRSSEKCACMKISTIDTHNFRHQTMPCLRASYIYQSCGNSRLCVRYVYAMCGLYELYAEAACHWSRVNPAVGQCFVWAEMPTWVGHEAAWLSLLSPWAGSSIA